MIEMEVINVGQKAASSNDCFVVLKEKWGQRCLTIWVGLIEAQAIAAGANRNIASRPLSHQLILSTTELLGGRVSHAVVDRIDDDVYYSHLVVELDKGILEIDARPSDAIAVVIWAKAPIYVDEQIMAEHAGIPDSQGVIRRLTPEQAKAAQPTPERNFAVPFAGTDGSSWNEFINGIDLDDFDERRKPR